jgi:hypothetical protein
MTTETARKTAYWIGWSILICALGQWPMILLPLKLMGTLPDLASFLLVMSLPVVILATIGAVGLILGRMFGFYLIYLATIVSLWSMRFPYLPFVKRILSFGSATPFVFLALNLVIVAVLVWTQLALARELPPSQTRKTQYATLVVALVALAALGFWRTQFQTGDGTVADVSALPLVGRSLSDLQARGPLQYHYFHSRAQNGISMVFSGTTTEEAIKDFAQKWKLNAFSHEQDRKFLGLVKSWKLNKDRFPPEFGVGDLYYSGRLTGMGKALLQVCYRRTDGRFTAQFMATNLKPTEKD